VRRQAADERGLPSIRTITGLPPSFFIRVNLRSSAAKVFLVQETPIDFDLAIKSIGFILLIFLTAQE
jgi:hypothetical protein